MAFIIAFLVAVAGVGALLYLLVVHREVPGAVEQRFGVLEPLPPDVGKWRVDRESERGISAEREGLRREVRVFHDVRTEKLTFQVRLRNPATNAIVRTDPDVRMRRRRIRA